MLRSCSFWCVLRWKLAGPWPVDRRPYALRAEGIGKSFGTTVALKAGSVWAVSGEVVTLMGRNGSGKTTLLKAAAGVLTPDYGVVAVNGVARERQSLWRLARQGVMYLPQGGLAAPGFTVADHFAAFGRVYGRKMIREAVELVEVDRLLDQRCSTLSGGEAARVSLGLAFARQPTVLLADEPLVGLTPKDQESIGAKLVEMARRGIAVVTSGHDVRALFAISDQIIWSVAGTTHHLGGVTEALKHAQFRREYLGPAWDG